jgi:ribose 5-phosphate isomerase B
MKISIGSDHRGFILKQKIIENFPSVEWSDVGVSSDDRTDYPIYAKKVCSEILNGKADLGILLCGSGVGMAIAANRHRGIYAANCWSKEVAALARQHDGINVLVLPADFVDLPKALEIIKSWLGSEFKGGRYQERLEMIDPIFFEA